VLFAQINTALLLLVREVREAKENLGALVGQAPDGVECIGSVREWWVGPAR
jgi:hypothetical protein